MFALAYLILPFSATLPADAIRASLAPFQRGQRGDLPESWLSFDDETEAFLEDYEAQLTITTQGDGGMQIKGGPAWYISTMKVLDEMRRLGLRSWSVRFADTMDINEFYDRFSKGLERHPNTGAFGRWLNPLGRWDWWDLGGRFDGRIIGDERPRTARSVAKVSSGANPGRMILANIKTRLADRLGQEPFETLDVQTDQNIELVATLLEDARSNRANACPSSLVLPPRTLEDRLRWLDTWPHLRPQEAFAWLGLSSQAGWDAIVRAVYARFEDHWAAGVAYHH
jgi:hypothetical protein